jgi:hypothetical protein
MTFRVLLLMTLVTLAARAQAPTLPGPSTRPSRFVAADTRQMLAQTRRWLETEAPKLLHATFSEPDTPHGVRTLWRHETTDLKLNACTLSWVEATTVTVTSKVLPSATDSTSYGVALSLADLDPRAIGPNDAKDPTGKTSHAVSMTTRAGVGKAIRFSKPRAKSRTDSVATVYVDRSEDIPRVVNALARAAVLCGAHTKS